MFTRTSGGMNRIQIRFEKETRALAHGNLIVVVKQGSWNRNIVGDAYVKVLENVVFPFEANISSEFEFVINQPGDWEILVLITPTKN